MAVAEETLHQNGEDRPLQPWGWTAWQLMRHFGPRWVAYRLAYHLQRWSGWLAHRDPVREWEDVPLSSFTVGSRNIAGESVLERISRADNGFFFSPHSLERIRSCWSEFDSAAHNPIDKAVGIAAGSFSLFHVHCCQLGIPPVWNSNGLSGEQAPADRHWSQISDFDYGDIKVIWDLNRFNFAFDLARAYVRTSNDQWAELFWRLLEDWRFHNLPNRGPNWKCGQEASLRVLAWCFALHALAGSKSSTPDRVLALLQMIAFTGRRVASNVAYAVSQKNNHGISEAVGLWTIGSLFPQLKEANAWRATGRRLLSNLARKLIYEDGTFSQHSWNYHRLMLHDYVWAIQLGVANHDPLPEEVVARVRSAGAALGQAMDWDTGDVPSYGQDDGSLILPLNNCGYFDYRPIVQATEAITAQRRVLQPGRWDEDLLWLLGPDYCQLPIVPSMPSNWTASESGYMVMRAEDGFACSRAARFLHRPAQTDMLHVDIWHQGLNVTVDPGTFSYNAPAPWNNPLATAFYHNTVTVDGVDQMTRIGRFVWLPWLQARSTRLLNGKHQKLCYWQGEHDGYRKLQRPIRHRRGLLRLPNSHWLVIDRLESDGRHHYRLHWLLHDLPHTWNAQEGTMVVRTNSGKYRVQIRDGEGVAISSLVRADPNSPRGWKARGYQCRQPALSIDSIVAAKRCWFFTLLGPGEASLTWKQRELTIADDRWLAAIKLHNDQNDVLLQHALLTGEQEDELYAGDCKPAASKTSNI